MNILIIRVSSIGDVIHTIPAVFFLRQHLPHATITWVVQKKAAGILVGQPWIDHLVILPDNFLSPSKLLIALPIIKKLGKTVWDAIVDFQGIEKTALLISMLKGKKFGFSFRHARNGFTSFLTDHHSKPTYTNIIDKNLLLAQDVVYNLQNNGQKPAIDYTWLQACLTIPKHIEKNVTQWLATSNIQRSIILNPNTTWASKRWPTASWKKLVDMLCLSELFIKHNYTIIITGSTFGDQAQALALHAQSNHATVKIAPPWELITVAALLKTTDLIIAPDTGILHLADLLGRPSIGIFGPTLVEKHGPCLTKENINRAIQVGCSHLYQKKHQSWYTFFNKHDCMADLTPKKVMAKIHAILSPFQE